MHVGGGGTARMQDPRARVSQRWRGTVGPGQGPRACSQATPRTAGQAHSGALGAPNAQRGVGTGTLWAKESVTSRPDLGPPPGGGRRPTRGRAVGALPQVRPGGRSHRQPLGGCGHFCGPWTWTRSRTGWRGAGEARPEVMSTLPPLRPLGPLQGSLRPEFRLLCTRSHPTTAGWPV